MVRSWFALTSEPVINKEPHRVGVSANFKVPKFERHTPGP